MNNLTQSIRRLRGKDNYLRFAGKTGVNRQTLKELEEGASVRLATLKRIAKRCKVNQQEWTEILIGWIRREIGEEHFCGIDIRPAPSSVAVRRLKAEDKLLLSLFHHLSNPEKAQILKTMMRREVRSCLPTINEAWESGTELNRCLEHQLPAIYQEVVEEIGKLEDAGVRGETSNSKSRFKSK